MPPPAPTKPQIKPTITPQATDWKNRFRGLTASIDSLAVITGRTRNLMPRRRVINTEKPPMVALGRRLATQLPTRVNRRTTAIITRPFLMSRFLFL